MFPLTPLLVVLVSSAPTEVVVDDGQSYDALLAAAEGALEEERPLDAVSLLEALVERFPQDYAAWLLLGNAALAAELPATAERAYREASRLSEGNPDARLGLAWAFAYQGLDEEARVRFVELERSRPEGAAEGIGYLERPGFFGYRVSGAALALGYVGDPVLDGGAGLALSASGRVSAFSGRGTVRAYGIALDETWTALSEARGRGARALSATGVPFFAGADLFASVGAGIAPVGGSVHYHLGIDGGEALGFRHTVGVVVRLSLLGDARVELNGHLHPDQWGTRAGASWSLLVWRGLFLEPGIAAQVVNGLPRGSAAMTGGFVGEIFGGRALTAYGHLRAGVEERPVFFRTDVAYPLSDLILGVAGLGTELEVADGHAVFLDVEALTLAPALTWPLEPTVALYAQLGWRYAAL